MKNSVIGNYKNNGEINLEQIILEYMPYLYKIICNSNTINLNKEDIEELLYETFFIVWNNSHKLEEDKPLLPYLVGIIKNLIKKKYRDFKISVDIENYDNILISADDIDSALEEIEINKILQEELNKFSVNDREIFELFYYHNKKTKDIAHILKTKDTNIRSHLHRMRKILCKRLEGRGYGKI